MILKYENYKKIFYKLLAFVLKCLYLIFSKKEKISDYGELFYDELGLHKISPNLGSGMYKS